MLNVLSLLDIDEDRVRAAHGDTSGLVEDVERTAKDLSDAMNNGEFNWSRDDACDVEAAAIKFILAARRFVADAVEDAPRDPHAGLRHSQYERL